MTNSSEPSTAQCLIQLKALVADVEKMMEDSLSGHSATDYEGLRERFDAARAGLSGVCAGAKEKVAAGAKSVDQAIRANPYQSVAIAAGIGLLVGGLVTALVMQRHSER